LYFADQFYREYGLIYILNVNTKPVGFTMLRSALEDQFSLEGDWKMESLIQLKRVDNDYPIVFSMDTPCITAAYTGI